MKKKNAAARVFKTVRDWFRGEPIDPKVMLARHRQFLDEIEAWLTPAFPHLMNDGWKFDDDGSVPCISTLGLIQFWPKNYRDADPESVARVASALGGVWINRQSMSFRSCEHETTIPSGRKVKIILHSGWLPDRFRGVDSTTVISEKDF